MTLTEADDGKTVELHAGDTLVVRLSENPTAGYRWSFDSLDTQMASAEEDEYVRKSDAVGSGGEAQWTVKAKKPGTTEVKLKLWRHFEGDRSVQKRFSFIMTIKPGSSNPAPIA
jgi:inhibitor of cysteine peptidase